MALWVVAAIAVGTSTFAAGLLMAPVDFAAPPPPTAAVLLDAHGKVFAKIASPQMRAEVPAARIPKVMRDAIVAAEDERFFEHSGVDPFAILRAGWRDITGAPLQGGSTLTQQYVKNVYVGDQRTALRKLREAALAFRLEHTLSKQEILTRYLNAVYLGNGTYGVQAASTFYFGVPISDIDLDPTTGQRSGTLALARASMLAGMAPAPSIWNPLHDPKATRDRQLYTLNRMVANGMISAQEASAAYGGGLPRIVAQRAPDFPTIAPEFRDLVDRQLRARFGDEEVDRGGLRVTTSLDLDLQQAMVQALRDVLPNATDPEAAVVAIDPRNGDIRAMTQKKDGGYTKNGLNLALYALRSSGSTIKPFTLAAALGAGHSLDERVYSRCRVSIPNSGGTPNPYVIKNAGGGECGYSFTLRSALAHSVNTIYGPLALDVGLAHVFNVARAAGMSPASSFTSLDKAKSLGVNITPISEAVAFSTLVDHGVHHDARSLLKVTSQYGNASLDARDRPNGLRVLPKAIADQVTEAMGDVVKSGTGTRARQPFPVYGKTGTTDNNWNAWFTGCTRQLCITVWMGYDKPRPMVNLHGFSRVDGGTLPAEIFAKTWAHYRALRADAERPPTVSPQPEPTTAAPVSATTTSAAPAPHRSTPSPSTSAAPTTTTPPQSSPSPQPTDSGGGGLFPPLQPSSPPPGRPGG